MSKMFSWVNFAWRWFALDTCFGRCQLFSGCLYWALRAMWGRLTGLASSVTGLQGHDAQQVGTFYINYVI